MDDMTRPSRFAGARRLAAPLILFFVCAAYLVGLSSYSLLERDEGRYAEVAREMLATGDWVTPRLNGAAFLDKPPLTYWLTAGSYALFGVGEFAARIVPGLLGIAGIALTWWLGRRLLGPAAGALSAVILASSPHYLFLSRTASLDLPFAVCVTAALTFAGIALERGPRARAAWLAASAAAGLATLAKGPAGAVLPALAVVLYLAVRWRPDEVKRIPWIAGLAVFLAIVLPWFAAVSLRNPGFLSYFLLNENVRRFATDVHHREGSVFYYLPVLLLGFFPWSLLLATGAAWRLRKPWTILERLRGSELLLPFCWSVAVIGFFSLSRGKLATYVLPAYPALALLTAGVVAAAEEAPNAARRRRPLLWMGGLVVLLAAAPGLLALGAGRWPGIGRYLDPWLVTASLPVAAGCAALLLAARRQRLASALAIVAAILTAILTALPLFQVGFLESLSAGRFGRTLLEAERLRPDEPVVGYHCFLRGLPFYLGRTVPQVGTVDDFRAPEARPSAPESFWTEKRFQAAVQARDRLFLTVDLDHLEMLQGSAGRPLYVVDRNGEWLLLSNAPGERTRGCLRAGLGSVTRNLSEIVAEASRRTGGRPVFLELHREEGNQVIDVVVLGPGRGLSEVEFGLDGAFAETSPDDGDSGAQGVCTVFLPAEGLDPAWQESHRGRAEASAPAGG